jgi:hypothetical protein
MLTVMVYCFKARSVETETKKKLGANYDRQMKIFRRQLTKVISIPQKQGSDASLSKQMQNIKG